ncbi:hypothetical protein ACIPZ8_23965 [Pseudomonas sp. NPDC089422]
MLAFIRGFKVEPWEGKRSDLNMARKRRRCEDMSEHSRGRRLIL